MGAFEINNNNKQQCPFNGRLSGTTQMSWYHKDKTNLDFLERDSEWQWHQQGNMQICILPQTDMVTIPL